MTVTLELTVLADLVAFARVEQLAADIEPWAAVIAAMHSAGHLSGEQALWATKLYNAYDDLGSAWTMLAAVDSPDAWASATAEQRRLATSLPLSGERRNLRGGKVTRHLDSYTAALSGSSQLDWLTAGLASADCTDLGENFSTLMPHLRTVWGTGRQSAFEWGEFTAKVAGLPVDAPDAYLWESSGPRIALQRLYGNSNPSREWLDGVAAHCHQMLYSAGVKLSWWDFETVICDFNVMRNGRYYPGQHIAMIRAEIEGLPDPHRSQLRDAFTSVVPSPWSQIPPGVDRRLRSTYRDVGVICTPTGRTE